MRLPLFSRTFRTRQIGPRTGLALVVGSALLLATLVSNSAAHRGDGPRYRGGAGYGHSRVYGGPVWSSGPRRYRGYHGPRFQLANLDDYTEHLRHKRHPQTIDIIEKRSGERLHTLEFVDGEWQSQIRE